MNRLRLLAPALLVILSPASGCGPRSPSDTATMELLNVSYDPTRELYREFNAAFARHWRETTGQNVTIRMSHGGSGSQARAVIDGLEADVVTLALASDIDAIAEHGKLLPAGWQGRLPLASAPYTSTLAFLVRRGNPKNIRSWEDLGREGVEVITPNPKTSGAARWNYLAIWGYVLRRELGEDYARKLRDPAHAEEVARAQAAAREFTTRVYRNVPVLDRAARAATNTFVQRRIGDVLINWENEILLGKNDLDAAGVELVIPEVSVLAQPTVAVVDRHADRRGARAVAEAYLEYLYSPVGQDIAGRHYCRPTSPEAAAMYAGQFPKITLFTIDDVFGGWAEANRVHFADGGEFDRIYRPR